MAAPRKPVAHLTGLTSPEELLALSEGDFYSLVDHDVRDRSGALEDVAQKLRDPLVVDRWYHTLLRMKKAVEGVIAARASENKADRLAMELSGKYREAKLSYIDFLKWRSNSLRFKTGVEEKLTEASWRRQMLLDDASQSVAQQERNRYGERLRDLQEAIFEHRRSGDDETLYLVAGLTTETEAEREQRKAAVGAFGRKLVDGSVDGGSK